MRHLEELSIEEFKLKILGKEIEEAKPSILDIIQIHNTHFTKLVNSGERSRAKLQKYDRVNMINTC